MKNRRLQIGLVVLLSLIIIFGVFWYLIDDKRAAMANEYIKEGQELEQTEQNKQAYFNYKKAQMATPRSFAPYYHQGMLLESIGQTDMAVKAYQRSIQFAKEEMAPTFALAKTYYNQKNYLEAEKYFQHCFAYEPTNSELYFWLGKSQMNQNRLAEAQKSFKIALETFPSAQYHLYLGLTLAYQDIKDADEEIEKYTKGREVSFQNLNRKVLAAKNDKTCQQIEETFKRMLATESPATRKLLLGQLLNQIGESGLATAKLTELTEEYPDLRDGWVFLAYGQIQENQIEEAIESLNKAEEIDPTYSLTYELLSKAYQANNQTETAKEMQLKANMLKEEG
jgi:tetratricopeptide (TPR) repeat protein